jgi:hypothetical protein
MSWPSWAAKADGHSKAHAALKGRSSTVVIDFGLWEAAPLQNNVCELKGKVFPDFISRG